MNPNEIRKHCLACRQETLHRRVAGISAALYACTMKCGSPGREVSDPWSKTPENLDRIAAAEKSQQETWAKERAAEGEVRSYPELVAAFNAADAEIRQQQSANEHDTDSNHRRPTMTTDTEETQTPLMKLVGKILDQKLAAIGLTEGTVSRGEVLSMIQSEFAKQLGEIPEDASTEGRQARRTPPEEVEACRHKNFMRKCASCQARKAAV